MRRTASDPLLRDIAARHGATALDVALAWLTDLSELIVPIPGPTRVETAASLGRPLHITLTEEDRARLDERFPAGRLLRRAGLNVHAPRTAPRTDGEVVLIMGLPAAGKSTAAHAFVERGYVRVNRDEHGGSLRGLLPALDRLVASGSTRPVRCVWLSTTVEDAQVNAASRMLAKFGRLLGPEEIRQTVKQDVSAFGPGVQFRYQRDLEPPHPSEGFSRIETIPFVRAIDTSFTNRALIVWCDGVLTRKGTMADVVVERGAILGRHVQEGWRVLGLAWQPGIADGTVTIDDVDAAHALVQARLGIAMDILYCPHAGGPPVCWCRKPLPGLGVVLIQRYRLDPSQCIYVGGGTQDPGFARRLGFQYRDAGEFFAGS
jgi:hypothetical protein